MNKREKRYSRTKKQPMFQIRASDHFEFTLIQGAAFAPCRIKPHRNHHQAILPAFSGVEFCGQPEPDYRFSLRYP